MSKARQRMKQRDPERYRAGFQFMAWVKQQPCAVPYCVHRSMAIDAHHAGDCGLGQKADDRTAIPLCRHHHLTGSDSVHQLGRRFWPAHGIDKLELIAALNRKYEAEHPRRESNFVRGL